MSTINAIKLFLYYLDYPEIVLKDFRDLVAHNVTSEELFKKYDISLRNQEKTNEAIKMLQLIQEEKN